MRKVSVILTALGLSAGLAAPALAADDLSYSFLELGYVQSEIDDVDVDGNGFGVRGSFGFTERFHGFLEYTDVDYDFDVNGSTLRLGGGMNWDLSPKVDLIGTVSYINAEVDAGGLGNFDDSGFGLGASLRGKVSDQFELRGGLEFVSFDEGGDDTSFGVGARFYFTRMFALGLDADFNDDGTTWMLGGRFDFNKK